MTLFHDDLVTKRLEPGPLLNIGIQDLRFRSIKIRLVPVLAQPKSCLVTVDPLSASVGTNSVLQLQAENDANYFGVDDISVTPIPAPTIQTAAASGSDFLLSCFTATGLTYQTQYKTDLAQAGWINLGSSFVATNSTSTLLDSNAIHSAPQRYYRVVVSLP